MLDSNQYLIRRKIMKLLGADFRVFDSHEMNNEIMFSHMKAFKLKEDIRLYKDESKAEELVTIKARNIIDFSAAYDIMDAKTEQKLGAMKRKGMASILRDEWQIMDIEDNVIGFVKEDSGAMAIFRRFVSGLIPQRFDVTIGDKKVAEFQNNFNPMVSKLKITFLDPDNAQFPKLFGIAAGMLICAIEGKQG